MISTTHNTSSLSRHGLTITEVIAGPSVLALLIGGTISMINSLGCDDGKAQSIRNLMRLNQAHAQYAAEWDDRQFTLVRDNLGEASGDCTAYNAIFGCHPPAIFGEDCSGDLQGFCFGCGGFGGSCDQFNNIRPIDYNAPTPTGSFRLMNARGFHEYVGGKFYDPTFYAPKEVFYDDVKHLFSQSCEFVSLPEDKVYYSSYILSAAAMYHPDVFGATSPEGQ